MLSAIYLTGEAEKDKYTINVRGLILINKGNVLYLKLLFLGSLCFAKIGLLLFLRER